MHEKIIFFGYITKKVMSSKKKIIKKCCMYSYTYLKNPDKNLEFLNLSNYAM